MSSGRSLSIVRATPFLSISRLIAELGRNVADSETRRTGLLTRFKGKDRPARVDLELTLEPVDMVSNVLALRRASDCTPVNVLLRERLGLDIFFGDNALRTDFMMRSSSVDRFRVLDLRLCLANISCSLFASWI